GRTTWVSWDDSTYPYLAAVRWSEHAPLTLVVENRTQTELAILSADPATGKTRQLMLERDAAWLNLDPQMPMWLPDGSGFLWTTERNGARQLELRAHDGSLARTITPLQMGYRDLLDLDPQGAHAVVRVSTDPTRVRVMRIPLLPGTDAPEALSPDDGLYSGAFSHDHGTWV